MRVSKLLAAGALMAAAFVTPALAATAAQAAPPPPTTMDWTQEGPFSTFDACDHRRRFWDQLDGRSHYCQWADGTHETRGWWIRTRG
ncbi:hypothetical protein [Nonomuraea sp. NPDC049028]|uniref:hypothetical protein n=1 Tax=Nonomuraea sp. NPDC049028 TaxID=3364348 RepID=UPI00371B9B27